MLNENSYEDIHLLENCRLCPKDCRVNRISGKLGYCNAGAGFEIASIDLHKGEEPVISGETGICNVFFGHCNLQCVFCQNYQISGKECNVRLPFRSLEEVTLSVKKILNKGASGLGFVSPSHMVLQMKAIIRALRVDGYYPVIVYNSSGYDSVETLKSLEGWVDVYLPDFKYSDNSLSALWSDTKDYKDIAIKAIKEMYRQKGNVLRLNECGIAENGILVRHLVLPGAVENSIGVLRLLAEEISSGISLSLMAQYHPIEKVSATNPLNRKVTASEYLQVAEEAQRLGFQKGWIQDHESSDFYLPDFESGTPFQ